MGKSLHTDKFSHPYSRLSHTISRLCDLGQIITLPGPIFLIHKVWTQLIPGLDIIGFYYSITLSIT